MQRYISKSKIKGYERKTPIRGDYPTREWVGWSMESHTEEEIKERVLRDRESVCYSYICERSKLSEKFIIELAILSLDNSITKRNYDKKMEELVPKFNELYDNRLDWLAISRYQKLSMEFIRKYKPLLDCNAIARNQLLDYEFIKENVCVWFPVSVLTLERIVTPISKELLWRLRKIEKSWAGYRDAIDNNDTAYLDAIWKAEYKKEEEQDDN